ncbi:MAG: diphosphate--fructose-6-phosphate 1-phosphotransferase [Rectinemataceae bacterium]
MNRSPLQNARYAYTPKLPDILNLDLSRIGTTSDPVALDPALNALFSHSAGKGAVRFVDGKSGASGKALTVGVLLSGGPAPGGHNVIAGLFDGLKKGNPASRLLGFKAGPGGLVDDKCIELGAALIDEFRNTGGFDIIGSGRTKIETPEQFEKALATALRHSLDALVVVGGDDSNTNAALLAEFFASRGSPITVVGVPKTIDGDLKNDAIEASFGFDTATKVYSELVGNICRDAASGRKYWHFIKLMGRSASHIALECALQTRPNVTLISEEVEARRMSLADIVGEIAVSVAARSEKDENFGVVLIPEGLIEFVPEVKILIAEINEVLAANGEPFSKLADSASRREFVHARLGAEPAALYASLPPEIQAQLCWDRDPHGNVQVSRIETEKLLASMVGSRMARLAEQGAYKGKFDSQTHFMGYEGRCAFPSNFDADYCYSLGFTAFLLAAGGYSGYLSTVKNLAAPAAEWRPGGVPLVSMMNIERRHGADKPVIKKALVDLGGRPFAVFAASRAAWATHSDYRIPGGIQYFGPAAVADAPTLTLMAERG